MAQNALLQALPPATDYLTYLTILEYNLTADELPTLHGILQDTTLTANIGWDLVHLLLPLLPASRECLDDVARLGNPREVVLKVTELLQDLGRGSVEVEHEYEEEAEDGIADEGQLADKQGDEEKDRLAEKHEDDGESKHHDKLADKLVSKHDDDEDDRRAHQVGHDVQKGIENRSHGDDLSQKSKSEPTKPTRPDSAQGDTRDPPQLESGQGTDNHPSLQLLYRTLLEMLSILHPRIKTKYPSRFLMASIRAIFPAHPIVFSDPSVMEAALGFIRAISGVGRPKLPPRKSSVPTLSITNSSIAPDPEGKDDALGPNELPIQTRLLQVFLTSTILHYITSLSSNRDIPGMAWCSRLQEKVKPEGVVHFRRMTFGEMFFEEDELHGRDAIVGQIVALARDLGIKTEELLSISINPEISFPGEDVAPPSSASVIPLNQQGSFYLLCAIIAASSLLNVPKALPDLQIFPEYASLLSNLFGDVSSIGIGSGVDAFVDALLFLGFFILNNHAKVIPPDDPKDFNCVLLQLAILSAESPSPSLRYHAHVLTSSILHSHPSDAVKLEFIRDTLEHCSYGNLKASAVGWLKHELLAANKEESPPNTSPSLFQSPSTISTLAPFLFPNPRSLHHFPSSSSSSSESSEAEFLAHHSFYLASLNLYYLLLSSPRLLTPLKISILTNKLDLRQNFLQPLRELIHLIFKGEGADDDNENDNGDDDVAHGGVAALFEWNIKKIEGAIRDLEEKS